MSLVGIKFNLLKYKRLKKKLNGFTKYRNEKNQIIAIQEIITCY